MAPWDPSYPSPGNWLDYMRASAWAPPNLPLFRPAPSQFADALQDQWQPSALNRVPLSNALFAPINSWSRPQAPSNPTSPPSVLAANDEAPPRPWGLPGSPTDAFNPWLRGAVDSLDKTIRHFRSGAGYGDDAMDSPDCMEEWRDARELCAREMSKPNPSRGITGGAETIEECARGHVSERCGGNVYERPRRR